MFVFGLCQCLLMHAHLTIWVPITVNTLVSGWIFSRHAGNSIDSLCSIDDCDKSHSILSVDDNGN